MLINTSLTSEASTLLQRLISVVTEYGHQIPDDAYFWIRECTAPPRLGCFAPVGAELSDIFRTLTHCHIQESDLRMASIEADGVDTFRWLAADGMVSERDDPGMTYIRQLPSDGLCHFRISACLLGTRCEERRITAGEWLRRVSLPVVLTPATAACGTAEIQVLQQLQEAGRNAIILVTNLRAEHADEEAEIIAEIEQYKIAPLRKLHIDWPVIYACGDNWVQQLLDLVAARMEDAHRAQFLAVVHAWLDEVRERSETEIAEDSQLSIQLDTIYSHLNLQQSRMHDVAARIGKVIVLDAHDRYQALEDACHDIGKLLARQIEDPIGGEEQFFDPLREKWSALDELIRQAPSTMNGQISQAWADEVLHFGDVYSDIIPKQGVNTASYCFSQHEHKMAGWQRLSFDTLEQFFLAQIEAVKLAYKHNQQKETTADNTASAAMPFDEATAAETDAQKTSAQETAAPDHANPLDHVWVTKVVDTLKALQQRVRRPSYQDIQFMLVAGMVEGLQRYVRPRFIEVTNALDEDMRDNLRHIEGDAISAWKTRVVAEIENRRASLTAVARRAELLPFLQAWRNLEARLRMARAADR